MAKPIVKDMSGDKVFVDLILFAQENIGRAAHDGLSRFKWAEYGYSEGVAAISYVLCRLLCILNRQIHMDPDDLGLMVKEMLIQVREEYKEDDDED